MSVRMYLKLVIVFFTLVLWTEVPAAEEYNDVVLVDNGAVVQGRILPESKDKKKLKIEREDGYVVEIPRNRIKLISKSGDPVIDSLRQKIAQSHRVSQLVTEWRRFLRAGVYNGEEMDAYAVAISFGLSVQGSFVTSAGIGWDHYRHGQGDGIPIFLEFTIYISKGEVSPHIYLNFGATPFFSEPGTGSDGEYFLGWGLGLTVPVGEGFGVGPSVGYRTQSFVEEDIGFLTLMVGLQF